MHIKKILSTFIIAEAGVNHNGDTKLAKRLIREAAKAGADAIKFQTFKTDNLVTRIAELAEYQKNYLPETSSQYNMLKKLEIDYEQHLELINYASEQNILFMSTGFDLESNNMLNSLNLEVFKIPSGEITNLPYLRQIGSFKKDTILSTGMSNLGEIETAIDVLISNGCQKSQIKVLHCSSQYPTPMDDVNLQSMLTIKNAFNIEVGYSDHTTGIEVAIAAVALGGKIIEKHLTIDREMPGPDHKASIEPDEFKKMVDSIRNIEKALGSPKKFPNKNEIKNRALVRKSIIASRQIEIGEKFNYKNITIKRPGTGLSPMLIDEIIGKVSTKKYYKDDLITL
tara:strand:- start:5094 stop:6113 length:1020 start_codon:yes stop_codon:yes gene_type:complete